MISQSRMLLSRSAAVDLLIAIVGIIQDRDQAIAPAMGYASAALPSAVQHA